MKILLVDDCEADIKITLRAFNEADGQHIIFSVQNGQEALNYMYHKEAYQDEEKFPCPDIILMDINMPKVDGLQVLEKLKADTNLKMIPIIMLTSSKNIKDINTAFALGANSYIAKPVDYRDFVNAMDTFLHYWVNINQLPQIKKEDQDGS